MWRSNIGDLYMSTNPFISMINDDEEPGQAGQQNASFLKRLPAEIQVHLSKTDNLSMKELAQQADQLFISHQRSGGAVATVAAEEQVEESVLAVVANKLASGKQQPKKKNKKLVTYCWVHHKFGEKARRCDNPTLCQWGN
jgi:hypothetical protein